MMQTHPTKEKQMSEPSPQEAITSLSTKTQDMHHAIVSLTEELAAIDSYNQRAEACKNKGLRAIFEHNRDEEKEHASMLLEWIRRHDSRLSKEMKNNLFTERASTKAHE
jgi:hypothetical protein